MSFKWLLGVLKGGQAKMLTSAKITYLHCADIPRLDKCNFIHLCVK